MFSTFINYPVQLKLFLQRAREKICSKINNTGSREHFDTLFFFLNFNLSIY